MFQYSDKYFAEHVGQRQLKNKREQFAPVYQMYMLICLEELVFHFISYYSVSSSFSVCLPRSP